VDLLSRFLVELPPHRYCVACLAHVADRTEAEVHEALTVMGKLVESTAGECWLCTKTDPIYRVGEGPS